MINNVVKNIINKNRFRFEKVAGLSKKYGFDHWLTLLIAAAIAIAVGIAAKGPLSSLATDIIDKLKQLITTFLPTIAP